MKLLLIICCQLPVLLVVSQSKASSFSQEKNAIAKIMYVADSLFEIKNYQKSIIYYKRIIRLAPDNLVAKSKIEEINTLIDASEKTTSREAAESMNTSDILTVAKSFQEKRIENFESNKREIYSVKKVEK